MAGAEFCLSNKRKLHQGLGDEIMEIATEWKTHRVADRPRNEALGLYWFDRNGWGLSPYPCGLCF